MSENFSNKSYKSPVKSAMFLSAEYKQNKMASQRSAANVRTLQNARDADRGGLAGQQYAERAMTSIGRWVEVAFRPL